MKEKHLTIPYLEYASETELSDEDRELVAAARAQWGKAYAPYSRFLVGAALLLADGTIVGGANQENAAYPMCLCAERVALGTAWSQWPEKQVMVLAVASCRQDRVLDRPGTPCGACRQVIRETEERQGKPMRVLITGETGPVLCFEGGHHLLPLAFSGSSLT